MKKGFVSPNRKETQSVRLERGVFEKIEQLAIEGNVSLWIRTLVMDALREKGLVK